MYKEVIIGGNRCITDGEHNYTIHTHKEYGDYIYVDNKLNTDDTEYNDLFTGRIKDAVETIRNGDGDVIEVGDLFGQFINVQYFLDRTVGEKLRAKSIEGWKDTKFAWIVTCGRKDSLSGYVPVKSDYTRVSPADKDVTPAIFNERSEAVDFINTAIEKAKCYAKTYSEKAQGMTDSEAIGNIAIEMSHAIKADYNSKFPVVLFFAQDMVDDKMCIKNDYEPVEYGYCIEQYCLP